MTVQTIKRMFGCLLSGKKNPGDASGAALRRDTLLYSFPGCDPDHGEAGGCCEDFRYQ